MRIYALLLMLLALAGCSAVNQIKDNPQARSELSRTASALVDQYCAESRPAVRGAIRAALSARGVSLPVDLCIARRAIKTIDPVLEAAYGR